MDEVTAKLLALAKEAGLLPRCLGCEEGSDIHVLASKGDDYPEGCFHISAVDKRSMNTLRTLAAAESMQLRWTHIRQPTLHACKPWINLQYGVEKSFP